MPRLFTPQVPMPAREVPTGTEWIHEIKLDGLRTFACIEGGRIEMITRGGANWSRAFRSLVPALLKVVCREAIIDGEVAAPDELGVTRAEGLREIVATKPGRLVYFAFDLLWLDGEDCRQQPLVERKARLEKLIQPAEAIGKALFVEHVVGVRGEALFRYATETGCTGIVSKRAASLYRGGKTRDWLKIKAAEARER